MRFVLVGAVREKKFCLIYFPRRDSENRTVDAFLQAGVQGLTNVGNKKLSLSEELLVIPWYLAGCCQRLDHCE